MTCIAMQPLITSCCYEGMRMLHAVRPAQRRERRRPRDGAAGIRAAPEGRRCKEAAAAHPAATRQGTVVGWPPRRCQAARHAGTRPLWGVIDGAGRQLLRIVVIVSVSLPLTPDEPVPPCLSHHAITYVHT